MATEQKDAPPNILFMIADDWGAHASAYGTPWLQTPGFDQIAKQGLLFNNAFTPNAKCAPSRAILLTGRHSWQLEEAGNHLSYFPAKFKSWPEVLMDKGWKVGLTGKGWGPGFANDFEGKPRQITGVPFNRYKLKPPTSGIAPNDYTKNFVDFLETTSESQPWCFWVGFQEPHRAYEVGSGIEKGGKKLTDVDRVPAYWPDDSTTRSDMLDYAFEVEYLDNHVQRILSELEQRGLTQNTLVILTSDHGMPFPRCKGYAYPDSNHVPLAIRWPKGIPHSDRTIDDYVDFTDVAATVLQEAGILHNESGMQAITGRSWSPIFKSDKSGRIEKERDHVLVCKERNDVGRPDDVGYPIRGILGGGYLYLHNYEPHRWPAGNPETGYLDTDGGATKSSILDRGRKNRNDPYWQICFGLRPEEELYKVSSDPDCMHNLASSKEFELVKQQMREKLENTLLSQSDPRMLGNGKVFDTYPVANGAGFYERWKRGENVQAGWVEPTDFEPTPIENH